MDPSNTQSDRTGGMFFRPPVWWLPIEFLLLYVGIPVLVWAFRESLGRLVIPILLLTGAGLFTILWYSPDFRRDRLWDARRFQERARLPFRRFLIGAGMLALIVALGAPDLLFSFVRNEPLTWMVVVVLYPCASVYPQEIIFRTYPFHRYRRIFTADTSMVIATAAGFALAHLMFAHWISMTLSFAGGVLFARTYLQTGSTLQCSVEHALWGLFIFTIGLGAFFYGGAI